MKNFFIILNGVIIKAQVSKLVDERDSKSRG